MNAHLVTEFWYSRHRNLIVLSYKFAGCHSSSFGTREILYSYMFINSICKTTYLRQLSLRRANVVMVALHSFLLFYFNTHRAKHGHLTWCFFAIHFSAALDSMLFFSAIYWWTICICLTSPSGEGRTKTLRRILMHSVIDEVVSPDLMILLPPEFNWNSCVPPVPFDVLEYRIILHALAQLLLYPSGVSLQRRLDYGSSTVRQFMMSKKHFAICFSKCWWSGPRLHLFWWF